MNEYLTKGETISKRKIIDEYGIPEKTFQNDIKSLREYYFKNAVGELVYDRKDNCYRLQAKADNLTKKEIFAICKILIESRAFNKNEFDTIISKLLRQCDAAESKAVKAVIGNERTNYLELQHGKPLIEILWELAEIVIERYTIEIEYTRLDGTTRNHEVNPVGIMFSEFYFYLIAYMADGSKKYPTVFRIDRISSVKATNLKFSVPYGDTFDESKFRKKVQFMYSGELKKVRFRYSGNVEAVLDRLPTAWIEKQTEDGVIVNAEAYGDGIDMWLMSQGDKVEIL